MSARNHTVAAAARRAAPGRALRCVDQLELKTDIYLDLNRLTYRPRRNWSCDTGRTASVPRPPALFPRYSVPPESVRGSRNEIKIHVVFNVALDAHYGNCFFSSYKANGQEPSALNQALSLSLARAHMPRSVQYIQYKTRMDFHNKREMSHFGLAHQY